MGKQKEMMRFWSTFLLLTFVFLVPIGALLWMTNQAAKAEPIALREQLKEAQREKLKSLESEIRSVTKQWNVPTSLEQATASPYYAALSRLASFPFPVLEENTAETGTSSELSEELLQAIRDNNTDAIIKLTGVSELAEKKQDFIYSSSGRNLTFDAWKQLSNPEQWRAQITNIINRRENLHLESTSQLLGLARALDHQAAPFLENSLSLGDLLTNLSDDKELKNYLTQRNLIHLELNEQESIFIEFDRFKGSISELPHDLGITTMTNGLSGLSPDSIVNRVNLYNQDLYLHTSLPDTSAEVAKRQRTFTLIAVLITLFALLTSWFIARRVMKTYALTELKNSLLATATHELKTPLAASQALLETLERGVLSKSEEKEYMTLLTRENQRLGRLVDQFLTFSRTERNSIRREQFSLRELLAAPRDWLHLHPDLAQVEYTINNEVEEETIVNADLIALQTALINLLDNAVKFAGSPRKIQLRITQDGNTLNFSMINNGKPISATLKKKIFQPFTQADQSLSRQHEGIGLGLSIVRSVANAHGGGIDIDSNPEQTSFTLKIPINS